MSSLKCLEQIAFALTKILLSQEYGPFMMSQLATAAQTMDDEVLESLNAVIQELMEFPSVVGFHFNSFMQCTKVMEEMYK